MDNDIRIKLEAIDEKLDKLIRMGSFESSFKSTKLMKPRDIAGLYGVPANSVYSYNRWLLPNFGAVDRSRFGSDMQWSFDEVMRWNSRGIEERKAELRSKRPE